MGKNPLEGRTIKIMSSLIIWAAILYLLEISPISAVLVVVSFCILIDFGLQLAARAGFGTIGIGIAFILGSGFFTLVGQVLVVSGTRPHIAHGLTLLSIAGLSIASKRFTVESRSRSQTLVWDEATLALSISLIVSASRQFWLFPFTICLFSVVRLSQTRGPQSSLKRIVVPLFAVGWLISWRLRPDRWWYNYQGNDSQFFESIGWSIAHWGIFDHPGYAGGSIADYHWLIYAFNGSLSHVAQLAPWEAGMKLGPPLLAFLFVSVLVETSRLDSRSIGLRTIPAVLMLATLMPGIRMDSFAFSILVAMSFLRIEELCRSRQRSILQLLVLVLLSLALVFAKVSSALVVAIFLVVLLVVRIIRHQVVTLRPTAILFSTLGLTYLFFFRSHRSPETLAKIEPEMAASLGELRGLLESTTVVGQIVIWTLAIAIFRSSRRTVDSRVLALSLVIPAGLGFQILQANPESGYFGLPSLYLATYLCSELILGATCQFDKLKPTKSTLVLIFVSIFGLFLGFANSTIFDRLEIAVKVATLSIPFPWDFARRTGYFLIACVVLAAASRFQRKLRETVGIVVIVSLASILLGFSVDGYRISSLISRDDYTNWSGNSAPFPSRDLVEISRRIRTETPNEAILASNNFCCHGRYWWGRIAADVRSHNQLSRDTKFGSEFKWGGANYLLPAETRRRFLLQGLRFQTGDQPATAEQIRRMWLSLNFANNPTSQLADDLKAYGVSGFVVNLRLTFNTDWSDFAIEKFRNGNFVYLELT